MEVMSDYNTVFSDERRINEEGRRVDMQGNNDTKGDIVTGAGAESGIYNGGSRSLHYRVKSPRQEVCNIIKDVFSKHLKHWEELPAGLGLGVSWNLLWSWSKPRVNMSHLLVWQKVNHFEDSKQLTRKDLLKKNIQRYTDMSSGKLQTAFEIMPLTFILPQEYTAFVQAYTKIGALANQQIEQAQALVQELANGNKQQSVEGSAHPAVGTAGAAASTSAMLSNINSNINLWIMKPIGMSRGRGISIVKDLSDVTYSHASVVQRYVHNPLCLHGYKFDLRLYIVVTSFRPLEAFVYKEGFARVSTHSYTLDAKNLDNMFVHLTNSSIQKNNKDGPSKDNPLNNHMHDATQEDKDSSGSKLPLLGANGLWARLKILDSSINIDAIWRSIRSLLVKSLVVVDDKMAHQPCCFELFGFDVLIDSDLRPWLIEVNASPSLGRDNTLDVRVKNALIRDTINLMDTAPYDRAALTRILKRRLAEMSKNKSVLTNNAGRGDAMLEKDLQEILGGDYCPRKHGDVPVNMGEFEMLCPSTAEYEHVLKLKHRIVKADPVHVPAR